MRKTIFIFLALLTFMLDTVAQNQTINVGKTGILKNEAILTFHDENQTTIRFELNEIELLRLETEYGKAFIATSGNAPLMLQKGFPEIFFLTSSFIIPDIGSSELEISYGEYIDFENIEIAPSKGNLSRNIDPKTVPFVKGEVYQKDEFYPQTLASLREPFIMRDVRGQSVDVFPVQYNPVTKVLRAYSEITITVTNTRDKGINEFIYQKRHNTIYPQFNEIYNNLFINYLSNSKGYPTGEDGELLIICHSDFMNDMKPYLDWKRTIGRKTTIVSTATIGTTVVAIKDYISDYYNNSNHNLAYVLLVGDIERIPTYEYQYIHDKNPYSGAIIWKPCYTDHYYAQLTGSDPYLEILIGRMSAETSAHVQTQVQRTIEYERDITIIDMWLSKAIGLAAKGYTPAQNYGHDGGEADYVHMNNIRNRLLNYGYDPVCQEYNNNCGVPNTTVSQISQRFNDGVGVANYCNHGGKRAWVLSGPFNPNSPGNYDDVIYGTTDINGLTNVGKLPYIFSVACLTGKFTKDNFPPPYCLAEAWMRATHNNVPTGAVATFNATIEISAIPTMTAQDEFNYLCLDLATPYGQSAGIKRTFAGATLNATQKMLIRHGHNFSGTDERFVADFNSWLVFGDPTLMIRTKTPQEMHISHSCISQGMNSLIVTCDTEGALATVSYIDSNNDVIILGSATVVNGVAAIVFNTPITSLMKPTLAVTGFNKVTYISTLPLTINSIITWNSNNTINRDIVITNNATLIVNNCTISLGANAKITIQPGGKLIVDGGKITSACPDKVWYGIFLSGNINLPQTAQNQGTIELKNGAVLENMNNGIATYEIYANGNINWDSMGGIIKADNATFRNNRRSVEFMTYPTDGTNPVPQNVSYFRNCTFIVDDNNLFATSGINLGNQISMWQVTGVKIQGCTFENNMTNFVNLPDRNQAIFTLNAGYIVDEFCTMMHTLDCRCKTPKPSIFKGFKRAIKSSNSEKQYAIKIDRSEFERNITGIYLKGKNSFQISRLNMNLNPTQSMYPYGIYLDDCITDYKVEGNTIYSTVNNYATGILSFKPGIEENRFYRNNINNTYYGIAVTNSSLPYPHTPSTQRAHASTGLQFSCNEFSGNVNDIYVYSDAPIRYFQGTNKNGANNIFNLPLATYNFRLGGQLPIIYYYDFAVPNLEPVNRTNNIVLANAPINKCVNTLCEGYIIKEPDWKDIGKSETSYLEKYRFANRKYKEMTHLFYEKGYDQVLSNYFAGIIENEELLKEALEFAGGMATVSEYMAELSREALLALKTDSIIDLHKIREWYEEINTIAAKYSLAETYYQLEKFEEGFQTLAFIPKMFNLNENEMIEHQNYVSLFTFKNRIREDRRNMAQLNEEEIAQMVYFANASHGLSSTMAQGILCFFYEICFEEELYEEKAEDRKQNAEGDDETEAGARFLASLGMTSQAERSSLHDNITLHPNPTTGELTIEWTSGQVNKIEIFDIYGRKIHSLTPSLIHSFTKIDLSYLNLGIYFVKISSERGEIIKKLLKN